MTSQSISNQLKQVNIRKPIYMYLNGCLQNDKFKCTHRVGIILTSTFRVRQHLNESQFWTSNAAPLPGWRQRQVSRYNVSCTCYIRPMYRADGSWIRHCSAVLTVSADGSETPTVKYIHTVTHMIKLGTIIASVD